MNTIDLHEILRFGTALLTEAGKRTVPYFKQYQERNVEISYKKDNSPITEADTSTEQWIRTQLHESYPTIDWHQYTNNAITVSNPALHQHILDHIS